MNEEGGIRTERKHRKKVYEILVGFGEHFEEFSLQRTVNFLIR